MKSDILPLQPSLWRTCRVLANRVRLGILAELIRRPGQSVTALAARLGISVPVASQYLRQLNARGLLLPSRQGSQVFYRVLADRSIPHAGSLLVELRRLLAGGNDGIDHIFRHMTAFTHPRRVLLAATLGQAPLGGDELRRATGIPGRALLRHLAKLRDRGYVCDLVGGYGLARPESRLAVILMEQVRSGSR